MPCLIKKKSSECEAWIHILYVVVPKAEGQEPSKQIGVNLYKTIHAVMSFWDDK